jgi:hypothetical protein
VVDLPHSKPLAQWLMTYGWLTSTTPLCGVGATLLNSKGITKSRSHYVRATSSSLCHDRKTKEFYGASLSSVHHVRLGVRC